MESFDQPLQGMRVVTLAINLPGPVAAARVRQLGAAVVKVEPLEGDPLAVVSPAWYAALTEGQEIVRLNLKQAEDRARLEEWLSQADVLLTATRPAALTRLGLDWPSLHARWPRLCQVAIVGYPAPREEVPGHDLTYQAELGLLAPPEMPRTLLADLAAAEQSVRATLALLLARERGYGSGFTQVALANAVAPFTDPLRYGLTTPDGPLGGGLPVYNLYRAHQGWIAVAALEPHFAQRLERDLGLMGAGPAELQAEFLTRTAPEWEAWALERDLPIVAVRDVGVR